MSYKKMKMGNNGRSLESTERHLRIPHKVINHPNFKLLNGNSVKILIFICSFNYGTNNGKISVSYAQITSALHIGRAAIKSALDELQAARFLELKKKGVFTGRKATEWKVTFLSIEGLGPTNEWGSAPLIKEHRRKSPKKNMDVISQTAHEISDLRILH